jgi:FKBP-type peptidyl-prolyl cis-trans isomerase FkpA/FKBP-type peptidyl-prolyl cis-trans isomerase FklB
MKRPRTVPLCALTIPVLLAACAFCPAGAAEPALDSEEQKTLYALGLLISKNLDPLELSAADLEVVKMGLTDGILGHEAKVDLNTYGLKVQEMAQKRATASAASTAAVEGKAGEELLAAAAKEPGAVKTDSGLVYVELKPGTGASPQASDKVRVHYHGTLRDGSVFDSSVDRGEPADFPLGAVIPCWTEGLQRMKVGGKSKLVCPAAIAYGERGSPPDIKPGATLVFEVELLEILK